MSRGSLLFLVALPFVPSVAWPNGDPLGPAFRVNTYTTNEQRRPSVAADSSGNFVVVWQSLGQDGPNYGVFAQRYVSSGAPLGSEFRVNTSTSSNQFAPDVASNISGNFVVVWHGYGQDGSSWGVFGQRYASSGAPLGSEFRVNTYTTSSQTYPAVAVAPSGNFVVTWGSFEEDGLAWGIFAQRYASSGAPLGPEFRVNTFTSASQVFSSVAADSSGNFVVVWQSYAQDGAAYGIFGQRYSSSGAPLGPEFRVNTYTTSGQGRPGVVFDASGNFVVVWGSYTQDGSSYGVFGQRYASSGSPVGQEFGISTYMTGSQEIPSVAADSSGNFVVVWRSSTQDGSGYGVFGQRYASVGTPLGSEFRVNQYTTDGQAFSSVAADSSGNFVVVWQSNLEDGSGYGVFGQRYSQIVPVELMHFRVE